MRLVRRIVKFFTLIPGIFYNMALLILISITVMLFVESVVRTLFKISIITMAEAGGIATLLVVSFGLAGVYEVGGHLRVGFAVDRMPEKPRRYLELFLSFLSLAFVSFAIYIWLGMMSTSFESGRRSFLLRVPQWPVQLAAVIGWAVLDLAVLIHIIRQVRQFLGKLPAIAID